MDTYGFTIVALPAVDEKVHRISSEKVPHLTLLYLGENPENQQEIIEFVRHAASELSPIYLTVDYRDTLGPDQADVVFFEKQYFNLERIAEFRHHLLLNDSIKKAYDSVEQYPEWTPHVTLGYPDSPAHEDDADYPGIHAIQFDRIAVWTEDYDGPEFRLKYDDLASRGEMAMSGTTDLGALAAATIFDKDPDAAKHYGKKGMKWGVRNDKGHEGERAKTKKIEKLDKKFEKNANTLNTFIKLNNRAADLANKNDVERINNKPEYKDADFARDSPLRRQYYAEHQKAFIDRLEQAADEMGTNASGTRKYRISDAEDGSWNVFTDEVKHGEEPEARVLPQYEDGRITSLKIAEPIAHGEESDYELKHYGVKGMKWGVRKDESASRGGASAGPTSTVVTQKKPGQRAKASGGKGYPLHPDAETSLHVRQKAKKSTTDSLSNTELRAAVERMQLEKRYSELEFANDRRSRGARFAAGFFGKRKPTKYRDLDEDYGEQTAEAVKKALAARAAARAAAAVI